MPGRSRPTMFQMPIDGWNTPKGVMISVARSFSNPPNDAGNTPITVTVPSFRRIARPRTSGALSNIRFQ
jgi:hypothetical protein